VITGNVPATLAEGMTALGSVLDSAAHVRLQLYAQKSGTAEYLVVMLHVIDINSILAEWVRVEPGKVATPFVSEDPAVALLRCRRYLRGVSRGIEASVVNNRSLVLRVPFDAPMRVTPAATIVNDMRFVNATVYMPDLFTKAGSYIMSASMTGKGVGFIHVALSDGTFDLATFPVNSMVALATDDAILLSAEI
jgi:hypothetical protein